jgi:glycosyltransferase involved in cell wall biosynthesis
MDIKISLVTPSFNQGAFLEQTIDSVLSQGYPGLEYIIIDGGSTDESVQVIKKYERHLRYWISEPDTGQSHAIEKGLIKASGTVFNWLNSDDYLEPGALNTIAEYFTSPNVNVLCGRSNLVRGNQIIAQSRGTDIYDNNLTKTIGMARIDQPETWFRLNVLNQIGGVNRQLHYVMDKEIWLKYLCHFGLNGIKQTDSILANFRLHPSSKTVAQKELFEPETNALYQNLAAVNGCDMVIGFFRATMPYKDSIHFNQSHFTLNEKIASEALQYFLLHKADEFYYNGNPRMASSVLNRIDRNVFNDIDRIRYNKLRHRTRWPFSELVQLIRLWTNSK